MMRQASSRNYRNKGFKVGHVLQIGLLVVVCLWLLYQLKHSHDKKLAMEEKNSRLLSDMADMRDKVFDLGRKHLPEKADTDVFSSHETKDDETEKEEVEVEVEEEEKEDSKHEEAEDEEEEEGGGVVDDEIDVQDHERGDEEEQGEELDGEEKEMRYRESDFFEDQEDHEKASQEAREESYKQDDIAGSVHRETQTTELSGGNEDARASSEERLENLDEKDISAETVVIGTKDLPAVNMDNKSPINETFENSQHLNETSVSSNPSLETVADVSVLKVKADERKDLEVESSGKELGATSNATSVEPVNHTENNTNSTEAISDGLLEVQNNTNVLDVVTTESQITNGTVKKDSVENQNSFASMEEFSKKSKKLSEDMAGKDAMTTGLEGTEEKSLNASGKDETTVTMDRETDA